MLKIRHAVTGSLSLLIYRHYPTGDCFALFLFFLLDFLLLPSEAHQCSYFLFAIMYTVTSRHDFFSISFGGLAKVL